MKREYKKKTFLINYKKYLMKNEFKGTILFLNGKSFSRCEHTTHNNNGGTTRGVLLSLTMMSALL